MIIHIVKEGDTIASIAEHYAVTIGRLVRDNGLEETDQLISGQTIVIAYPMKTYTVQDGDSLKKIAELNGISLRQLLRNNPYLSDREYIFPGETLVISYDNSNGKIRTNGYANTFMDNDVLECNLPFLTYLTLFKFRTDNGAAILDIDETEMIRITRGFKVVPLMLLSTFTPQGRSNFDTVYQMLYNQELIDKQINNIMAILKSKGYKGVKVSYQFINEETRQLYELYTQKLITRLKQEGYIVFVIISENFIVNADKITFEKVDFTYIGKMVDGVSLLNYNWGYSFEPPAPVTSSYIMKEFLDYIVQYIPPAKIEIGIPIIGYDWEMPYIIGISRANSLTLDSAIALAGEYGSTIEFDEVSQTPYFKYVNTSSGIPKYHMVWFVDARTIDSILDIVKEYGLMGIGIWNIMNINPQIWLTINSQNEIETLDG